MKSLSKFTLTVGLIAIASLARSEPAPGLCDELKGTPNGAYGLCVAIMEVPADDCTPAFDPEGSLLAESLIACRPATRKLVDKFLEKTEGTDIKLPGADYQEPAVCPCQSVADTIAFEGKYSWPTGYSLEGFQGYFYVEQGVSGAFCGAKNFETGETIPGIPINAEEFTVCVNYWTNYEVTPVVN